MPPAQKSDESDISLIAHAIRRRIWLVVICLVAATVAAGVLTLLAEKQYSATSALLVRGSAAIEPQRVVDTNLELLSLPAVAERAALAVPGMSRKEVEEAVESNQQEESDVIRIKATLSDPERAAELANTFSRQFIAFRDEGSGESLQTGVVELVESATADDAPVSPKPVRNLVFGALIGLVLGLGLALLREQLDRRVKREDDLADATGLPLLASIPKHESFDHEHLRGNPLSPAEMEVFRLLRATLRYSKASGDVKSVLVTSAEAGEGKTIVSLGLALAAATSGERVLLLEADLRDPSLSALLDLPAGGGLSEALTSGAGAIEEFLVDRVKAADLVENAGKTGIDVIAAGAVPPNPNELIESQRMKDIVTQAEEAYDFVVIDTPPLLVVSDAIPLISVVTGVLALSGLGVSTRTSVADLTEQLQRLDAPVLGLVANFAQDSGRPLDGYGYGRPAELQQKKSASQAESR